MFKIASTFVQHHSLLQQFFSEGTSCGGLRPSINKDFASETAFLQFCALAVIGQMLTSPWLKTFYRDAEKQPTYAEAIVIVKGVMAELRSISNPLDLLQRPTDLFGLPVPSDAPRVRQHSARCDQDKLKSLLLDLLSACTNVIQRQYGELLDASIEEQFATETRSSRTHNIIAEELVGMFSAAKARSPHATTDFHSSRIRLANPMLFYDISL
jgi:hypothetical protein